MSPRKWVLLILPVTIAFIVGGFAPTLMGEKFNLIGALLWGGFILIIDYNFVVIEKMKPIGWISRIVLVIASALITASVGDHLIFKTDIDKNSVINDCPKCIEIQKKIDMARTDYASFNALYIKEVNGEGSDTGAFEGPIAKNYNAKSQDAKSDIKKYTKELESLEGKTGIITEMNNLYSFVFGNTVSAVIFIIFMAMILAIETLPLTLKDGKTANDLMKIRIQREEELEKLKLANSGVWKL